MDVERKRVVEVVVGARPPWRRLALLSGGSHENRCTLLSIRSRGARDPCEIGSEQKKNIYMCVCKEKSAPREGMKKWGVFYGGRIEEI